MLTWHDYQTWLKNHVSNFEPPKASTPPLPAQINRDSRALQPGDWFLAIKGPNFDGHDYLAKALANGAAGVIYNESEQHRLDSNTRDHGLAVKDTLAAFQAIALGWRLKMTDLTLVALTGSSGKTTVKEMVAQILKEQGASLTTEGSFNNEIGVPLTLAKLKPEQRYAALEFGARHKGDIAFLNDIAHPNVCAVLNVGTAHIGEFGSVENLLNTKLEMFRNAPDQAKLVAYHDDPRIISAAKATGKTVISFGEDPNATARIRGYEWLEDGRMVINLTLATKNVDIELPAAHSCYPVNIAAASAIAHAAGITSDVIKCGLANFKGVTGRYIVHRLENLIVIDDAYNANPQSMKAGLESLATGFPLKKKVVVLGDMRELGSESPSYHRDIGLFVANKIQPAFLVTVGEESVAIRLGAIEAGFPETKTSHFQTVEDLLQGWQKFKEHGDLLYVKGSNGIKLSKLVQATTH